MGVRLQDFMPDTLSLSLFISAPNVSSLPPRLTASFTIEID